MVFIYKFCKKRFFFQKSLENIAFLRNIKKLKMKAQDPKFFWANLSENVKKWVFFWSCDFNFNFFGIFSKMRRTILILLVVFFYIFCSSNFCNSFFSSIVEKLNISAIYESVILIFSVNLLLVFIYKFYHEEIQILQPGEPREQHLGEVWQGTLIYLFLFFKKGEVL